MRDLNTIALAVQNKETVTPEEFAYLLHNNKHAFLSFLIANNPGAVTNVLRHKKGYTHELGFKPTPQTLGRICDILLERNDTDTILEIIDGTPIKLNGLSPELIKALKQY